LGDFGSCDYAVANRGVLHASKGKWGALQVRVLYRGAGKTAYRS
jgi:hypothetical protein